MTGLDLLTAHRDALATLCQEFGVVELEAFGSVLRPDFGAGSDIDLLVTFAPDQDTGLFHLLRLQHRLQQVLGRPVDLVPKAGLRPHLRQQVLQSARRVYAA